MDFHDAWLRRTPTELLVPEGVDVTDRFEAIRREAHARAVPLADPLRFAGLTEVARILDEVQPPDAAPEFAYAYGALVWYCFRAWAASEGPLLISERITRRLAERGPALPAAPLAEAGHLQLPRGLFWVRPDPDGPAEPVDGIYWEVRGREVGALVASGMREGRPGLGIVVAPPLALDDAQAAVEAGTAAAGPRFGSTLPGGEEAGLLSLDTAGDVHALLALVHGWLHANPESLSALLHPPSEGVPRPSRLPYRRVG
ncbi:MAG: hypothetical protein R3E10_17350 [Gemmatimonadota bacterium]